jgi:hypothetical protein
MLQKVKSTDLNGDLEDPITNVRNMAAIVTQPACPALPLADAELAAAGVEFRILLNLFFKARRLSEPNGDARDPAIRLGMFQGLDNDAMFKLLERIDERFPLPVPSCDDITDAMDVVERIMALSATTIAGLAAKAEVVRFFNPAAFAEDDGGGDLGDLGAAVRALVEAISALAGRSPQVGDIDAEGVLE